MKAVLIKWLGPTNTRGSRLQFSADGWPTKSYSRNYSGGDNETLELLGRYFADLKKQGVRIGPNVKVVLGSLPKGQDVAALTDGYNIHEISAFKSNPAARKKRVSKKKAATRKKAAAKKKTTARKRIAINAPSRATGKPPSKRLRSRRARNTVPGAYPNPAKRKKKPLLAGAFTIWAWDGINAYVFTGHSLSATRGIPPETFPSERAAREVLRMFVIPNFKRSFAPGAKPWAFAIRPANTRIPDAMRFFREKAGIVPGKM